MSGQKKNNTKKQTTATHPPRKYSYFSHFAYRGRVMSLFTLTDNTLSSAKLTSDFYFFLHWHIMKRSSGLEWTLWNERLVSSYLLIRINRVAASWRKKNKPSWSWANRRNDAGCYLFYFLTIFQISIFGRTHRVYILISELNDKICAGTSLFSCGH